jgi:hypothetical protein
MKGIFREERKEKKEEARGQTQAAREECYKELIK